MTVTEYNLYYGITISLNKLGELGFLDGIDGVFIEGSDYWSDNYIEFIFEGLVFQIIPHDYYDEMMDYYVLGIRLPNICSVKDILNAEQKFKTLVPLQFKDLEPKLYNIQDDCHCCS